MPENSQAKEYLPCDYTDTFTATVKGEKKITPEQLMHAFWDTQPQWVSFLFKLRNQLVKPFGLNTSEEVEKQNLQTILNTEDEMIICLNDKHLKAYLSIYVETNTINEQEISIITVVHYHYWLGKAYFTLIRPFHSLVVKQTLRYILKKGHPSKQHS